MSRPLRIEDDVIACDVAVVGAGPAGSALACRLAARGHNVVVVERATFPRDKLCGGFLSPEALPSLAALGVLEDLRTAGAERIDALLFTAGGASLERPLPSPALALTRRTLDAALASAATRAGARVLHGRRALRAGDGVVECEGLRVAARAVVDASGRLGNARERAAGPFTGLAWKLAPRGRATGRVEIHAFDDGYLGTCAVEGGVINACALVRTSAVRAAPDPWSAVARAADRAPGLRAALDAIAAPGQARPLATSSYGTAWVGPRHQGVVEIGDAAGSIAPACGEGLAMALRSAELAADLVERGLRGGVSSAAVARAWRGLWRREFRRRLIVGSALQAVLVRSALAPCAVRLAALVPAVADVLLGATRDLAPATRS